MIRVNEKTKSLSAALADLCVCHLQWSGTTVSDYNFNEYYSIVLRTVNGAVDTYNRFCADSQEEILPFFQLFGLVTGQKLPGVDLGLDQSLFDMLRDVEDGQPRAKRAILCLGGVDPAGKVYTFNELCEAYALHVEDPSVPMLELLAWQYKEA